MTDTTPHAVTMTPVNGRIDLTCVCKWESVEHSTGYDAKVAADGHGPLAADSPRICETCDGDGEIDCEECEGSGENCSACGAVGSVECDACNGDMVVS